MYSFEQIPPGSPWPSEMEISVEDSNLEFLKLAYIHYRFQLTFRPEFLKLSPTPSLFNLQNIEESEFEVIATSWLTAWKELIQKISKGQKSYDFSTDTGLQNLEKLMDYNHDQFQLWRNEVQLHANPSNPIALSLQPEVVCVEALIKAWEDGLLTVVVSPIRGEFFDRVTPEVLIVSPSTRSDPRAYNESLNSGI